MANKDLRGKTWTLPREHINHLRDTLKHFRGNKKTKGYTRLKRLIQNPTVSYETLKNIKHTLEGNKSNPIVYRLNGGQKLESWVNNTLKGGRTSLEKSKKAKKEAGFSNAYKKSHTKDKSKGRGDRTPMPHKSMSSNDINNNNMNYENKETLKSILIENIINQINHA